MLFVCATVCMCVYLWGLSPSISFAIEFGIIFHFCLRISHTHTDTHTGAVSKGHKWLEWVHGRNWEPKVGDGGWWSGGVSGMKK